MNEEVMKVAENTVEAVAKIENKEVKAFIFGVGVGATATILVKEAVVGAKKLAKKIKDKKPEKVEEKSVVETEEK